MARLEDLLTFKEGDPDVDRMRGALRETMANVRWEIMAQQAELAFWEHAAEHGQTEAVRADGRERALVTRSTVDSLVAKYSAFEAMLAALPAEGVD